MIGQKRTHRHWITARFTENPDADHLLFFRALSLFDGVVLRPSFHEDNAALTVLYSPFRERTPFTKHSRECPYSSISQRSVRPPKLKEDLGQLDAYYNAFPESVKAQGIVRFVVTPPTEGDYLTPKLWDKFLPAWREPCAPASDRMMVKAKAYAKSLSDQPRLG